MHVISMKPILLTFINKTKSEIAPMRGISTNEEIAGANNTLNY